MGSRGATIPRSVAGDGLKDDPPRSLFDHSGLREEGEGSPKQPAQCPAHPLAA